MTSKSDSPEHDEFEEMRTHTHPSGTHMLVHMYAIYWNENGQEKCHLTGDSEVAERNARAGAVVESNCMTAPTTDSAGASL